MSSLVLSLRCEIESLMQTTFTMDLLEFYSRRERWTHSEQQSFHSNTQWIYVLRRGGGRSGKSNEIFIRTEQNSKMMATYTLSVVFSLSRVNKHFLNSSSHIASIRITHRVCEDISSAKMANLWTRTAAAAAVRSNTLFIAHVMAFRLLYYERLVLEANEWWSVKPVAEMVKSEIYKVNVQDCVVKVCFSFRWRWWHLMKF